MNDCCRDDRRGWRGWRRWYGKHGWHHDRRRRHGADRPLRRSAPRTKIDRLWKRAAAAGIDAGIVVCHGAPYFAVAVHAERRPANRCLDRDGRPHDSAPHGHASRCLPGSAACSPTVQRNV
ncbi:ATP-dependent RNA helicase RhlB [Oxalobacteraceae sp. CFBP 8763]|nr:ATP-dependent RNA helicase RhlB [Oxalobacteraceae sp. CFBP 8763]